VWSAECNKAVVRKALGLMDMSAVQSEISSIRAMTSAPETTPVTGAGSFEDYLSGALQANEPASNSKLSQTQHSSKASTAHANSQTVHVANSYASVVPGDWHSLDPLVMSSALNPSSSGVSESTASRSAATLASRFQFSGSLGSAEAEEKTSTNSLGASSKMGLAGEAEEKTGARSSDSLPKTGLPEDPEQATVAKSGDSAAGSSQSSGDARSAENASLRNASSTGAAAQESAELERAFASLEGMDLSVLSGATSAERAATMSAAPTKIAATSSVSDRSQASIVSTSVKSVSAKSSEQNPSQTLGKGAQPSNGNGPDTASASGDSAAPAKAAPSTSGDNSKNSSSQENSSKPASPASPQTTSSGNASGSSATTTSLAAQVANSGFPQALNQAAQTTNPASPAGASSSATASQPGAPDKMEAAADNPVDPGGVINSASLMQSQGKTEMHVAMQTDTLGALQLHAVLDNGQLGASIQVVSHDAHTVLTNDLPALQQVLKEQNLRIDHLAVINSPMTSGAGSQNGRSFQSEDFNQSGSQNSRWPSNPPAPALPSNSGEALPLENRVGRLSVRA
jgi:trimeric autotransporter adhesin